MVKKGLQTVEIFDFQVLSSPRDNLLDHINESIGQKKKLFIITPNPEIVIASKNDPSYFGVLQKADIAVADGIGLIWAREVLKESNFWRKIGSGFKVGLQILAGRFTDQVIGGTDLMIDLCRLAARNDWPVYLLGGGPGVAEKVLEVLKNRFPGFSGWAEVGPVIKNQKSKIKNQNYWAEKINAKSPTFLFVALGMKKQEEFIWQNWRQLKVNLAMGIGGAFDQIAAPSLKSPKSLQKAGLGWLYRLIRQPWRIKKQLALLKFIFLVLADNR